MEEQTSQTSIAPTSGASNANDFQPTTRNPQPAPVNLFQQQGGVQNVTNAQELLVGQQNARITITKEPAPAQAEVVPTRDATGLVLVSAVAVVVAILLFKISNKLPQRRKLASDRAVEPEIIKFEEATPVTARPVPTPKKKSKKKSAKRKRR